MRDIPVPSDGTGAYTPSVVAAGDEGPGLSSLIEAAESWRRSGRLSEARHGFRDAAAAAERAGDMSALVTATLGLGGVWVHEHRDVVDRAAMNVAWGRARAVVPAGTVAAARLSVREAAEAVYEGAPVEPVLAAVEHVRVFGEDAATAEALSLLHHVQLGARYAEQRLGLAEEIILLGARAGDAVGTLMGLCWRTVDLFLLGDPRAAQSLEELRERSAAEGCEALGFIADVHGSMLLARAGRLVDADVAAAAALERGTAAGDPDAPAYYGGLLAALRWWQGRAAEIAELVRTLSASPRLGFNDHVYVAADALLSASLDDVDSAQEALARLTGIGLRRLPDSSSWLTTQLLVIEAAYLLGNADVAAEAGELLAPYAHLPVMPSLAVVCFGSAERGLGLAAATAGHLDRAVSHLDAALRADRRLGSRPMATFTEHTLARVLRARAAPGDEARAEQLARQAEARAARMGMVLPTHPAWLPAVHDTSRWSRRSREASLELCPSGLRILVDGRATVVPDRVGFSYLAALVARPGRDLDVMRLASGLSVGARPTSDALLDEDAIRSYRRRARELTAILERTDLAPSDIERYRREFASLTAALQSAKGLGGRRRAFPNDHERARTAVRKALVRSVAAIAAVETDLGHHLRASLTTGVTCRYAPTPGWTVTVLHQAHRERASDQGEADAV